MIRHSKNGLAVAKYLETHPAVTWVNYPGLDSSNNKSKADKYLPKGAGALLTFGIKGGLEAGKKFIDSLTLFSLVANVGDSKSLVIHPASTTHSQLSSEARAASGTPDELVRLSIGLEDIEDIITDLSQALDQAQSKS